jgi:hypothetical protein
MMLTMSSEMDEEEILAAVRTVSQGYKDVTVGLANTGHFDEYQFGLHQHILVDLVNRPGIISRRDLLSAHSEWLSVLAILAHQNRLPVSFEFETILRECDVQGITIPHGTDLKGVRSLKSFPTEAPVVDSVYVDEAGTPTFEELTQPVLTLVGVLVNDEKVKAFDVVAEGLLRRFDLPADTEMHAHDWHSRPWAVCDDA